MLERRHWEVAQREYLGARESLASATTYARARVASFGHQRRGGPRQLSSARAGDTPLSRWETEHRKLARFSGSNDIVWARLKRDEVEDTDEFRTSKFVHRKKGRANTRSMGCNQPCIRMIPYRSKLH